MYIVDKNGNTYDSVMTSDINNRLISKTTTLYGRLWFKSDYTYDNNGNCISELITSNELSAEGENEYVDIFQDYATIYEYDEFNRLTRHMGLLIDEEYTYYGNNLRMGIYDLEGNLTTQHIYDGQNVAVDVTRDGTYTYKRGLDLVSRSKEGGEEEYYYFDPHGSVRAIVSETGEILDKYEYSDYGEVIGEYYGDNPFKYCAEYQDYSVREPKIYLRNRYYQPSTGRFLTSDPAQDGMNWYMYCGGDPVNYVDPLGLGYDEVADALDVIINNKSRMQTPGTPSHEYWTAYSNILLAKEQIENDVIYIEDWSNLKNVLSPLINGDNNSIDSIKNMHSAVIEGEKNYKRDKNITDFVFTAGLTVVSIPVAKIASSSATTTFVTESGINIAHKAAEHLGEKGRYVPISILETAIKYGIAKPDPQGSRATMYYIEMFKNGEPYTLEVLYDKVSNTIWHFLYK